MNMSTFKKFDRQKKILSLWFTTLIFFVILAVQLSFSMIKYYSNEWQIFDTINKKTSILSEILIDNKNYLRPQYIELFKKLPADVFESEEQRIRFYDNEEKKILDDINFMVLNNKWSIVIDRTFDSISRDDIIRIIIDEKNLDKLFYKNIDWRKYYFLKKSTNNPNLYLLVFSRSKYTILNVFDDFIQFLIILLGFSIILYYLIYNLVSKNLKSIENNMKDMEDFIHNAWHELKTPLAVVNSSLLLAKETKQYYEAIDDSIEEINKMNKLIKWLITLSSINKDTWMQRILIYKNIKWIIKLYETEIELKDIRVNVNKKYDLELNTNPEYFEILFSNLFGNAIKYNKKWWKIKVIINRNNLTVKDNWIWIDIENIDKIFDRFFQESDNRNISWFWIWLSLVKKICNIYWWNIRLKSTKWKGTEISIDF